MERIIRVACCDECPHIDRTFIYADTEHKVYGCSKINRSCVFVDKSIIQDFCPLETLSNYDAEKK